MLQIVTSLTDDSRGVFYDRHIFKVQVQATDQLTNLLERFVPYNR